MTLYAMMTTVMLASLTAAAPQGPPSQPMGDSAPATAKTQPARPQPENAAAETPAQPGYVPSNAPPRAELKSENAEAEAKVQPGYVAPKEAPRFELKEELGGDARTFAQRLSEILGAEVRLPSRLARTPTLAAGKWTAVKALDAVGKQIDGVWEQVYVFKPAGKNTATPDSKLAPAGTVSLHLAPFSFAKTARTLAERAGCRLEFPTEIKGRYGVDYEAVPVEKALADLGAQAGLHVVTEIRFTRSETDPDRAFERQEQDAERQAAVEQERRQAIIDRLQEITGSALNDANFPWEIVPSAVWAELDMTPEDVEALQSAIQWENEAAQQLKDETPPDGGDAPAPDTEVGSQ